MKMKLIYIMALGLTFLGCLSSQSYAAQITYNWTGNIKGVLFDTGAGDYTGTQTGDTFSGAFAYDSNLSNILGLDTSDGDPVIEVSDTWVEYFLGSGSGTVTNGTTQRCASNATLSNTNDDLIDLDGANFVASILGAPPVAVGTPVDTWGLDFGTSRLEVFVEYISVVPLYNDLSFQALEPWSPPNSPSDPNNQFAAFFILERDSNFDEIFSAYGLLTVSAVPVPAAVWLFGTALIGLVGFSKRRARIAA